MAPYYATTTSVISGEDVEAYDHASSVQLELPEDMHFDFIRYMLQHLSMNVRAENVYMYSQQLKQQGA